MDICKDCREMFEKDQGMDFTLKKKTREIKMLEHRMWDEQCILRTTANGMMLTNFFWAF